MSLDRRRFLQITVLGIVATVADSACGRGYDRGAALDHPHLLALLGPERVRELGTHYRAATPNESTAGALRLAISNGRTGLRIPLIKNSSLNDQIRDDFAADRTVVVDGWVLSVTEARQCALFSLTPA
jgi:hypothetical protein